MIFFCANNYIFWSLFSITWLSPFPRSSDNWICCWTCHYSQLHNGSLYLLPFTQDSGSSAHFHLMRHSSSEFRFRCRATNAYGKIVSRVITVKPGKSLKWIFICFDSIQIFGEIGSLSFQMSWTYKVIFGFGIFFDEVFHILGSRLVQSSQHPSKKKIYFSKRMFLTTLVFVMWILNPNEFNFELMSKSFSPSDISLS